MARQSLITCDRCGAASLEARHHEDGFRQVTVHGYSQTYELCRPCIDALREFLGTRVPPSPPAAPVPSPEQHTATADVHDAPVQH